MRKGDGDVLMGVVPPLPRQNKVGGVGGGSKWWVRLAETNCMRKN